VTVQASVVAGGEDRPGSPLADSQVDRSGGARRKQDGRGLAALTEDGEGPMTSLHAERLDVGADRFGDPQPVKGQERDKILSGGGAESGGDEDGSDLVAFQDDRVGLLATSP
jgi:hypothetical protein